jgi:hypothetical protein
MEIKENETDVREIEELIKTAESQKGKKQKKGTGQMGARLKPLLPAAVVILLAIVLFAAIMSQGAKISSLETELSAVKSKINTNEIIELKSRLAALESKMDKSAREKEQQKEELAALNQKIEAMKVQKAKVETKKPVADKKKVIRKPVQ